MGFHELSSAIQCTSLKILNGKWITWQICRINNRTHRISLQIIIKRNSRHWAQKQIAWGFVIVWRTFGTICTNVMIVASSHRIDSWILQIHSWFSFRLVWMSGKCINGAANLRTPRACLSRLMWAPLWLFQLDQPQFPWSLPPLHCPLAWGPPRPPPLAKTNSNCDS